MKSISSLRKNYIKNITSSLSINVNTYIDGNNLYVNLNEDLQQMLDIFNLAIDTYKLTLDENTDDEWRFYSSLKDMDLSNTPDKLSNLAAYYINTYLEGLIRESIKSNNAKDILGEIEGKNNKVLFPGEAYFSTNFIDNIWVLDLDRILNKESRDRFIEQELSNKKDKVNLDRILNFLFKQLASIDGYKNLKFKNNGIFFEFLDNNLEAKKALINQITIFNLEKYKDNIFLDFKYKYNLYWAKIDINEYVNICKKKYTLTGDQFYKDNIKLLSINKLKPSRKSKYIVNIDFLNEYYNQLSKKIKANVEYGYVQWNPFRLEEKAVDTNLALDCFESIKDNSADIHCILTNDGDFSSLLKKANKLKKEIFLCSVVPKKLIAKKLKDQLKQRNILSIKSLDFYSIFNNIFPSSITDYLPTDFVSFIQNKDSRIKSIKEMEIKIFNKIENLKKIKKNFSSLSNRINYLESERYK